MVYQVKGWLVKVSLPFDQKKISLINQLLTIYSLSAMSVRQAYLKLKEQNLKVIIISGAVLRCCPFCFTLPFLTANFAQISRQSHFFIM